MNQSVRRDQLDSRQRDEKNKVIQRHIHELNILKARQRSEQDSLRHQLASERTEWTLHYGRKRRKNNDFQKSDILTANDQEPSSIRVYESPSIAFSDPFELSQKSTELQSPVSNPLQEVTNTRNQLDKHTKSLEMVKVNTKLINRFDQNLCPQSRRVDLLIEAIDKEITSTPSNGIKRTLAHIGFESDNEYEFNACSSTSSKAYESAVAPNKKKKIEMVEVTLSDDEDEEKENVVYEGKQQSDEPLIQNTPNIIIKKSEPEDECSSDYSETDSDSSLNSDSESVNSLNCESPIENTQVVKITSSKDNDENMSDSYSATVQKIDSELYKQQFDETYSTMNFVNFDNKSVNNYNID